MATILEEILTPSSEVDGVRYFNGEDVIMLAAALSDFGRDYMIQGAPDSQGEPTEHSIGRAVTAVYAGELQPEPSTELRLKELMANHPELPLKVIEAFGNFSYWESRGKGGTRYFDPLGEYLDLPESAIGALVSAHFSTLRRTIRGILATEGFVGEPKGRLNGLELRFFDSKLIQSQGYYGQPSGFFIYYFFDLEGHLVGWKTGIETSFVRDAIYTLIGGSVKAHDSYPGRQPSTMLTRAKFFDNLAGDIL